MKRKGAGSWPQDFGSDFGAMKSGLLLVALAAGHEVHLALETPKGPEAVDPSELTWPTPSAVHAATAAAWRAHERAAEGEVSGGPQNLSEILESFFKVKQIMGLESGLNNSEAQEVKRVEEGEEAGRLDLLYAAIVALIVIVALAYYKMRQSGKQAEASEVPQPDESSPVSK